MSFNGTTQQQDGSSSIVGDGMLAFVMGSLGCDEEVAKHYLKLFRYDAGRCVTAVMEHGDDPTWWAHPKGNNSHYNPTKESGGTSSSFASCVNWGDSVEETKEVQKEEKEEEFDQASSCSRRYDKMDIEEDEGNGDDGGGGGGDTSSRGMNNSYNYDYTYVSDEEASGQYKTPGRTSGYQKQQIPVSGRFVSTEQRIASETRSETRCDPSIRVHGEKMDDRTFYTHYGHIVDDFIEAVCCKEPRSELRKLILKADDVVMMVHQQESDLVNRLSFKHNQDSGRSPLTYAVAKNLYQQVYDLIDLGAEVSKIMLSSSLGDVLQGDVDGTPKPETALTIAATNAKRDGTEMVRILLSKGADPVELVNAGVDEEGSLGRGMKYWIDKARRVGIPPVEELKHMAKLPPMDRIHELDYAVVGEEAAVCVIQEALAGRFGNPQGNRKPLVMLLLGPPGHGKTYFSGNAARSLVGEDNFLFIPCQSIRDDADLFGSRLGGSRSGDYSSDGQLTSWLRHRQGKRCIVFLDEFEKMKDLTSSLGWDQAKKIYQSFLEPWNDGTLSDQSAMSGGYSSNGATASTSAGGNKIDCSQSIWIMTSNWGQNEIIDFGEKHKSRVLKKIDQKDVAWIRKELVTKILRPLCMREFASVHEDLKALCRRIDVIVPFLPFTKAERKTVADIALTERFSLYREPAKLDGPEDKRRAFGNLFLRSTRAFAGYAAGCYDPMQGASAMLSVVQQADGKFQMMNLRNHLCLTDTQKARVKSAKPPNDSSDEPVFWVHFDREAEEITISQCRPYDEDKDEGSTCSDESVEACHNNKDDKDFQEGLMPNDQSESIAPSTTPDLSRLRAADDAF